MFVNTVLKKSYAIVSVFCSKYSVAQYNLLFEFLLRRRNPMKREIPNGPAARWSDR